VSKDQMRTLIRLGWSQFTVVASGLGGILLVLWIAFMPNVEEFYAREFLLPQIADRYGFQFGRVQVSRDGQSYESPGIVSVSPDRAAAGMGLRPGDMPFAFHGNRAATMHHALMLGERGQIAEFDVVNAADWSAGRDQAAFRTIRVQPQSRER
jgi:hypothetical protein